MAQVESSGEKARMGKEDIGANVVQYLEGTPFGPYASILHGKPPMVTGEQLIQYGYANRGLGIGTTQKWVSNKGVTLMLDEVDRERSIYTIYMVVNPNRQ